MQKEYQSFAFLADLHALTTPEESENLSKKTLETAKIYLACGLDPKRTAIFAQSHVHEHSELAWILETITSMGELSRMTQFKEKSSQKESVNTGLFAYPVLMAADILLYQADVVPVGEDQKQHVELTRDIAQRFNAKHGETFKIPEIYMPKVGARIMGLDDASKKMSKSATSTKNYIALLDPPDEIRKKIKAAVTDSGSEVKHDPAAKPAVSNLMDVYSLATNKTFDEIEREFAGKSYGDFKSNLAEVLVNFLAPIQAKYKEVTDEQIKIILEDGAERAREVAGKTLSEVKQRVGLLGS